MANTASHPEHFVLIGDYLRQAAADGPAMVAANLRLMFEGVSRYCFSQDTPGLEAYPERFGSIAKGLDARGTLTVEEVAEAVEILREHGIALDERRSQTSREVYEMVAIFHRALSTMAHGNQHSIDRLKGIELDLQKTSKLNDIAAVRRELGTLVDGLREERAKEAERAASVVRTLRADFTKAQAAVVESEWGFPGRDQGLETLKRAWEGKAVAAIVKLDALKGVADRHGKDVVVRLVQALEREVAQRVDIPYTFFRWEAAAVALVFEQLTDCSHARAAVRKAIQVFPVDFKVNVGSRTTVFRIPGKWSVIGQDEVADANQAIVRLDTFLVS